MLFGVHDRAEEHFAVGARSMWPQLAGEKHERQQMLPFAFYTRNTRERE